MTEQLGGRDRLRRVRCLRADWRGRKPDDVTESGQDPGGDDHRRSAALDSNDRIRAEAPDDLETRRRSDQLEREIKHSTEILRRFALRRVPDAQISRWPSRSGAVRSASDVRGGCCHPMASTSLLETLR